MLFVAIPVGLIVGFISHMIGILWIAILAGSIIGDEKDLQDYAVYIVSSNESIELCSRLWFNSKMKSFPIRIV
jgi:hypothetical protein